MSKKQRNRQRRPQRKLGADHMRDAVRSYIREQAAGEEYVDPPLPSGMPWTRQAFLSFADHVIIPGSPWTVAYYQALQAFRQKRAGFTWHVLDKSEPTVGFAVGGAVSTITENIEQLFAPTLRRFINRNGIVLAQPGTCLGWWHEQGEARYDKHDVVTEWITPHLWHIDIVAVFETQTEAEELGRLKRQKSIYNFAENKEIYL